MSAAAGVPRLYWYRGCSTCRKALAWLRAHDVDPVRRDVVLEPLDRNELRDLATRAGGIDAILSTKSPAYRARRTAPNPDWLVEMSEEPRLLRRPILETQHGLFIGFDESTWAKALQDAR